MKLINICLLILTTAIVITSAVKRKVINIGDECKTYENKTGTCTNQRQNCEEKLFTQERVGRSQYRLIVNSRCGKRNERAICCTIHIDEPDYSVNLKLLPGPEICGRTLDDRIYGGNVTGLAEYPWMALLKYRDTERGYTSYGCSGSLINDRYVLTAAHCIPSSGRSEFMNEVRLGEWNLNTSKDCINRICSDEPLDMGVEETITHREYPRGPPFINDISLLRLENKITYTVYIKPICLPLEPQYLDKNYDEEEFTIAGWGKTEANVMSNKKMYTQLKGTPVKKCDDLFGNIRYNKKLNNMTQLCAGGDGEHDSCQGDSGGPLMHRDLDSNTNTNWIIIGIVSYGLPQCAALGKPSVYTRVAGFIPWILKYIRE